MWTTLQEDEYIPKKTVRIHDSAKIFRFHEFESDHYEVALNKTFWYVQINALNVIVKVY